MPRIHRTATAVVLVAGVTAFAAAPSYADPRNGDGWQTSVCANGSTYTFAVRAQGNTDRSQSFYHHAIHDSSTNTVLQPISGSGTVRLTFSDGSTVSFPTSYENAARPGAAGRTTTCRSVFDDATPDGGSVHVESTDVVVVSGR
jgi:hypothetical protein